MKTTSIVMILAFVCISQVSSKFFNFNIKDEDTRKTRPRVLYRNLKAIFAALAEKCGVTLEDFSLHDDFFSVLNGVQVASQYEKLYKSKLFDETFKDEAERNERAREEAMKTLFRVDDLFFSSCEIVNLKCQDYLVELDNSWSENRLPITKYPHVRFNQEANNYAELAVRCARYGSDKTPERVSALHNLLIFIAHQNDTGF